MSSPNFIFVITDGHHHDCWGHAGNTEVHTPYLDAIAKLGVSFTQATAVKAGSLEEECGALPKQLRQGGYSTAWIGAGASAQSGFDIYKPVPTDETSPTEWIGTQAVRFLQATPRPFCLSLHFPAPASSEKILSKYSSNNLSWPESMPRPIATETRALQNSLAQYYAKISLVDSQIGRLLAMLSAHGHTNNVIVYTSTSGHGLDMAQSEATNIISTEVQQRVPLIISGIGGQGRGERSDVYVQNGDLLPTILEASGIGLLSNAHGNSLILILQRTKNSLRIATHSVTTDDEHLMRTREYALLATPDGEPTAFHTFGPEGLLDPENVLGNPRHIQAQVTLHKELTRLLQADSKGQ